MSQVQILDKDACIFLHANSLEKGIGPLFTQVWVNNKKDWAF